MLWGYAGAGKLWKSIDNGSTWASVPGPAFDKLVSLLSAPGDTLWVAASEAGAPVLWRGTASGTGWTRTALPVGTPVDFQIGSDDGNSLVVSWTVSSGGMTSFYYRYQSNDGGLTWSVAAEAFGEAVSAGSRWRFAKALRGINFGLLPYGSVQKSQDSGINWQTRLALGDDRAGRLIVTAEPLLLMAVSFSHHGSIAPPVAPVDWRFHLTQDGGASWTEWDAPASVQAFTDIGGSLPRAMLCATRMVDTQRLRSLDFGRTWQIWALPEGFATASVTALELGTLWAWNGSAALVSNDQGDTWTAATPPPGPQTGAFSLRQTGPSRLLSELPGGGVSISIDSGKTWQDVMVG